MVDLIRKHGGFYRHAISDLARSTGAHGTTSDAACAARVEFQLRSDRPRRETMGNPSGCQFFNG